MRLPLLTVLLITAALASACDRMTAPAEPTAVDTASADPASTTTGARVFLDPQGLRTLDTATNATRWLAFGTSASAVREAVSQVRPGQVAEQGTNSECPAGALDYSQWPDLTLWFQNDQFVGWAVSEPGPNTLSGIGVGATRVQLERDYQLEWIPDSTLGTEFVADDMSGLIGDDGTITNLWAGTSCNFR